jgi:uncharacterized protein YceK
VGRVFLIVLFLGLALLISGCGSSRSTTTASQATTAAGAETKTYTDADYGYRFEYPTSWVLTSGATPQATAGATAAGNVGAHDPNGTMVNGSHMDVMLASVYNLNLTVSDSALAQLKSEIESGITTLESQDSSMKVEEALAETTAAGMTGYMVTYSFTRRGTPAMSTLYFLFKGNKEYELTIQASTDHWEADQPIFQAMIASFQVP